MSGTMTDGEVVTSFRQAKNKREQIGILSELNLCSKSDILNILCAAGEAVPEEADAKVMADGCGGDTAGAGRSGRLGDILDMICRLVSAMACEPGKVHIDMPEDDAALLEMDFGSCAVRVML